MSKNTLPAEFYHPDGRKKTFAERAKERRLADEAKQREAPQPAEPPRQLTSGQYLAARQAERDGREAAFAARQPPEGPVNPFRARANELEVMLTYRPDLKQRYKLHKRWADDWDSKHQAEQVEAERREKLDSDPQVVNAREHCEAFLRTIPAEELEAAHEAKGIIAVGDAKMYWERVHEIESRIWAREDQALQAMKAGTEASLNGYHEQTAKAADALARMQAAESEAAK